MENSKLLVKSILQTLLFGIQSAKWVKLKAAVILFCAFNFLFFGSDNQIPGGGINYVLFTIILLVISAFIHKKSIYDSVYIWSAIGMILSAINIFYLRTDWATTVYFISFLSFVGSISNNNAHNVIFSSFQAIVLLIVNPFNAIFRFLSAATKTSGNSQFLKSIPYVILPAGLVIVFGLLYSATNSILKSFLVDSANNMDWFYSFLSFERIFFWLVFFLLFGVLFVTPIKETLLKFGGYTKKLIREEMPKYTHVFSTLDLSKELKIANISLSSLNILLLATIMFDVFVMLSSSYNYSAAELSTLVHSGTKIVTFTIAVSAGLVILFFRRNLNFHPKNQLLIKLANIWLSLNGVYVAIVGLKNAKYIIDYGLTAKRLSVVIFLAACLTLLVLSHLKIKNKWSIQYFLNRFLGAVCVILLMYSFIDHKGAIVSFAAHIQQDNIDADYLYSTCIHRQKLLYKHKDAIEAKIDTQLEFYGWRPSPTRYDSWKSYTFIYSQEQAFYNTDIYQSLNFRSNN